LPRFFSKKRVLSFLKSIEGKMDDKHITVSAEWDPEAGVFVAQSPDVPGLATEAATAEQLVEKLRDMIPELFALNGSHPPGAYCVEIAYTTAFIPRCG